MDYNLDTRKEIVKYCLELPKVYEDYPFHDDNWTVMRCFGNKKSFAYIFERNSTIWINVKCDPNWVEFWRNAYRSIVPAYHMNKTYWNSIIMDGSVPEDDVKKLILESYHIVKPKS